MNREILTLAWLLAVPFFVATAAGAFFFHGTSERLYRAIVYVVIAAASQASRPVGNPLEPDRDRISRPRVVFE